MSKYENKSYWDKRRACGYKVHGRPGIGRKYELLALKILDNAVDCNKTNFQGKYDIIWNDMKIDVKSSEWNRRVSSWRFTLRSIECQDAEMLFCIRNGKVVKVLLVPTEGLPWNNGAQKGLWVGMKSKYDKYKILFEA